MFALRRKAVQSADRLGAVAGRSTRRYASKTADEAHHGHHHAGPKDEPLGTQFFFVLALIPASLAVYSASKPSADGSPSGLSKIIDSYSQYKEQWMARNTLHTTMVEQAAFDRNLFQSAEKSQVYDLKFPEVFNVGSPYNNMAGNRARTLEEAVAVYEKQRADEQERTLAAIAEKSS
ncbi:putative NADH-ubiquinone oxidoreductase subunit 1 [Coleophoma crateriformis]|uniref:Putative NADH-ubiquinone oxidoreductase subunit 1 n=1 Tax=Coleophoma crateriformis TaxID=565419 RepID=A0A3D8QEW0_9HELO|nr:putative NADH-ubiquinone oxidoreductase subunit 1 [Coleophoma crateriformis]